MALMKCHECGAEVSTEARTCPRCGATPRTATNKLLSIVGAAVIIFVGWYIFGPGADNSAAGTVEKINRQVAADATTQYNIAKQHGDKTEICVHAGLVAAAFLQAHDEANYKEWKGTERSDCEQAGIPTAN